MPVDPGDELVVANRVMYELLGRRWVWPPVQAVEEHKTNQRKIHLNGRPVRVVDSVTVDGAEIIDFRLLNNSTIELPARCGDGVWLDVGWSWTGYGPPPTNWVNGDTGYGRRTVVVDYTYGAEPPNGVENAIAILAEELAKAFEGNFDDCRLPSRVTDVSSRGISMTLLDPQDFLEDGLTGIPEVDLMIRVHNPSKAKARARVFSPDYRPGLRHQRQGS